MDETELVTNFMAATIPSRLHPDSLLTFTRRAIVENPFLTGMAISMEPNFFPKRDATIRPIRCVTEHQVPTASPPCAKVP